jgi:hypothetical protein
MRGQGVYLSSALVAAVLILAATAAAKPTASMASKLQIAVHEQGIDHHNGGPNGTFTIDLAVPGFAASGKTHISNGPGATKYVQGQQRIPFSGEDTLTTSKGQIVIAFNGTHIPVNNKATSSGIAVGPAVESGTWKIKSASGAYQGWKGGGPFAAAIYGYTINPSYSVEWDGKITR